MKLERIKLKPEVKALWTAALRSGEYKQGAGKLRNREDEFCCLGVLCDLQSKSGQPVAEWKEDAYIQSVTFGDESGVPPRAVVEWAAEGYIGQDRSFNINYGTNLTSMNDSGVPFAEIAALIDEKF